MTYKTGIIVLGTDERNQIVKTRFIRVSVVGELPLDYKYRDYIEAHFEERRAVNASAFYVGVGRWNAYLYWRRRPTSIGLNGKWLLFRDVQKEHMNQEATA